MAAANHVGFASTIQYCTLLNASFARLRVNALEQSKGNNFEPIVAETKIIDFGVSQTYISEDLVHIESREAGPTTAHTVTANGDYIRITAVTQLECTHFGHKIVVNCLVTPDLENTLIICWKDAQEMGSMSEEPIGILESNHIA